MSNCRPNGPGGNEQLPPQGQDKGAKGEGESKQVFFQQILTTTRRDPAVFQLYFSKDIFTDNTSFDRLAEQSGKSVQNVRFSRPIVKRWRWLI